MIIGGVTHAGYLGFITGKNSDKDTYKLALYTENAVLDRRTKRYTPQGEVSEIFVTESGVRKSSGYKAGGIILTGYTAGNEEEGSYLTWVGPIRWNNADIQARGALIYNASKDNLALSVFDFGRNFQSTNGPFIIPNPPAALESAMIPFYYGVQEE